MRKIPSKILQAIRSSGMTLRYMLLTHTGLSAHGDGCSLHVVPDVSVTRDLSQVRVTWHVWARYAEETEASIMARSCLARVDGHTERYPLDVTNDTRLVLRRANAVSWTPRGWCLDGQDVTDTVTNLLRDGIVYRQFDGLQMELI